MSEMLGINSNLSHYRILSKIGAGGMGEVYLAEDTKLERKVAIKFLAQEVSQNADRLRRFVQEAKAASALNHPNIITIHEIGTEGETHFIATELIEGETLRDKLNRERLTIEETLEIAIQTASALSAAHAAGIIHRDIKPENIMLREDRLVKVLDFGLAKLTESGRPAPDSEVETRALNKTAEGVILGTVAYMSPEQARGKEVDARTDIWSLGVCLYELLAGHLPFEGETTNDYLAAILKSEPIPIESQEIPNELKRIVRKTLKKDRDSRYQTMKGLLADLKDFRDEISFTEKLERSAVSERTGRTENQPPLVFNAKKTEGSQQAQTTSSAEFIASELKQHKSGFAISLMVLLLAVAGFGYWFYANRSTTGTPIESIAVLPFVNESGNADVEYLSDGMTESLITSLSQLPKLNVKSRSSVFRYKGKEIEPRKIGTELSVQAIVLGRVVQRGDNLSLYIELVDAATENTLWKGDYNRQMTNLVSLQSEVARDVATRLQARLSGADEQKLAKSYTTNPEAYQLYLKGRYHLLKTTRSGVQTSISYFQQATDLDPSYALAFAGLADAYRSLAMAGEMTPTEYMPKAKAAAQKAIKIDDTLADAHAILGFIIFWYDRDWSAAENQFKRALELDPNNGDTHIFYAHLLSNTGRYIEALAEAKRARELDPLNLRTNALEALFLIHAGEADEALARLQKIFELDANYWLIHLFSASAYIDKGMFSEAAAAARKARELSGDSTTPISFLAYALAKSGKQAEARAELEELLKLSKESYVSPYNIAMIYNGLDEREQTLAWLERGIQQRDPRMNFLKVERKWNNLRDDPRFQELLRRVGFP